MKKENKKILKLETFDITNMKKENKKILKLETFDITNMKKENKKILKLETFDWNKLPKAKQDKALLFIYRVLHDLEKNRKYGYGDKFWAQYP